MLNRLAAEVGSQVLSRYSVASAMLRARTETARQGVFRQRVACALRVGWDDPDYPAPATRWGAWALGSQRPGSGLCRDRECHHPQGTTQGEGKPGFVSSAPRLRAPSSASRGSCAAVRYGPPSDQSRKWRSNRPASRSEVPLASAITSRQQRELFARPEARQWRRTTL
jgi:hypothetical protein